MPQPVLALFTAVVILAGGSPAAAGRTEALLAVSWQPAFCEARPEKTECRSQTEARFDASRFSLHGLWPMGENYCGVDAKPRKLDEAGDWLALPALDLDAGTRRLLDTVMPGTQSGLQRHEWIKHGTCSGMDAERYYARSIALMEDLNMSAVADLFAENLGQYVSSEAIMHAFDEAFGRGAARRVKMKCRTDDDGRLLITELTIGLGGDYADNRSLGELIQSAGGTSFGCAGGIVDRAGLDR
ncbi:ribonuclease [Martelella lutilitoris]|uniref:Ribonuclease n=1 Tax=Martelella lutilitoris TaxID=2583532 RepID=A0A5C4JNL5_9HYPH|nr:ribonuclease [Martelella lutilitoris]